MPSCSGARDKNLPVIGYLSPFSPASEAVRPTFESFHRGLHELGWIPGKNVTVEYRWEVLTVLQDPIFFGQAKQVLALVHKSRLAAVCGDWMVAAGGLMSYAPSRSDLRRRAAYYIDKILKGSKPSDHPVERPTKFELMINLRASKQIGLTIPPNVLARADRVIK